MAANGALYKMSNLTVSGLSGTVSNNNQILVTNGHSLISPGSIIQCKVTRYDTATTYTTGTGLNGVELTDLRVSITPKRANSLIVCQFQIHGEGASSHNYIFRVFKNGSVPAGTYAGYNTVAGDQQWSGFAMALPYETDYDSTPFTQNFMYFDYPGVTSAITYAPGVKESGGVSYVWTLNRTVNASASANYERGVSLSIAWEIAQ
jgi:hypothetical protein